MKHKIPQEGVDPQSEGQGPMPQGGEVSDEPSASDQAKRLEALEAEVKDLKDRYLRARAELDNYRKRVAKEKTELLRYKNEGLLKELLLIKDHLENALSHTGDNTSIKDFHRGVELILKELVRLIEKFGVREIKSVGEVFDPSLHEAICQESKEGCRPGIVVKEFKKGYLYHDRLLRASSVSVSTTPQEEKK